MGWRSDGQRKSELSADVLKDECAIVGLQKNGRAG